MSKEKLNLPPLDWESLPWQETPYPGVFISLFNEKPNPENPKVPFSTLMAIRVDPDHSIPLHRHKRGPSWREKLTFPEGSNFEIHRINSSEQISNTTPLTLIVRASKAFGLKNNGSDPLFFTSEMKPGFTGYEEIEEVT